MGNSRRRLPLLICCVALAASFAAAPARAASLHIADAEATVAQGESAPFSIYLLASGALTCRASAMVAVDSSYSVATSGDVTSSDPADVTFSAAADRGSGHNCEPTWDGDPAPYNLAATASAAADTPLGDYTAPVHYEVQNAPGTGPAGKLSNAGTVNVTIHVVAPDAVIEQPATETTPGEQIVLGVRENAPRPRFGKSELLSLVSGNVRYRVPAGRAVGLKKPVVVPNGTVVDASKGVVKVTVERSAGGSLDSVNAWKGSFVVNQDASGTTTFRLVDGLGNSKGATAARANRENLVNRKKKKKKLRSLWLSGSGNFKSVGQHASAVARGTTWFTEDAGASTRVTVRQGAVAVRDMINHRTVIVTAGHSYTAKRHAVIQRRVPAFTGRAGRW